MSRDFVFQALRAVVSSDEGARYELLLSHDGEDTSLGPLHEYAARGVLACLGFAGVDIDGCIERAPVTHPAPKAFSSLA